jgi:hypothetical protein
MLAHIEMSMICLLSWVFIFFLLVPTCLSEIISRTVEQNQQLPVLIFNGKVMNDLGDAISGAKIQFWQTDSNGNYDHPASSTIGSLDSNFQYFGTATSEQDGSFMFTTRRPGKYTQRPVTHIHFKVWLDGEDLLTSQFYFADENTSYSDLLQLELQELIREECATAAFSLNTFDCSETAFVTSKNIVLDMGLGGTMPLTPTQQEGPFYPVIDFMRMDSVLLITTSGGGATPTESPSTNTSSSGGSSIKKISCLFLVLHLFYFP